MSRKHFEAMANAIARNRPSNYGTTAGRTDPGCGLWRKLRDDIADVCYASNGNFDRSRFEHATETR